jgi:hypothetical protein
MKISNLINYLTGRCPRSCQGTNIMVFKKQVGKQSPQFKKETPNFYAWKDAL